jgi:hypothetical protein
MKDRNVKQVLLGGGYQWEVEGEWRWERRVNMVNKYF